MHRITKAMELELEFMKDMFAKSYDLIAVHLLNWVRVTIGAFSANKVDIMSSFAEVVLTIFLIVYTGFKIMRIGLDLYAKYVNPDIKED